MEHAIKISKMPGYVYIRAEGATSQTGADLLFAGISDGTRAAGVRKVLVDARGAVGDLELMERFDFGVKLAEELVGLQVAFVVPSALRDADRFGETVALNRGANIRVVGTMEEACEWLGVAAADIEQQPGPTTGLDGLGDSKESGR